MIKTLKFYLILLIICLITIILYIKGPIAQDLSYHNFADYRKILDIPNFWNVISNVPFFIVGVVGSVYLIKNKNKSINKYEFLIWLFFFISIAFVCLGSSYYHLTPNNNTLVWDRLPMTLCFTSLLSIIIIERINYKLGVRLFIPLLILGLFSIFYWNFTELNGNGDLRPYILTQFGSLLLILYIVIAYSKNYKNKYIFISMLMYLIAKLCEHFDTQIYEFTLYVVSGHTLKHIAAALSIAILVKHYIARKV